MCFNFFKKRGITVKNEIIVEPQSEPKVVVMNQTQSTVTAAGPNPEQTNEKTTIKTDQKTQEWNNIDIPPIHFGS